MIYSVWNQTAKAYDYYVDGRPETTINVEAPRHLRAGGALGATVDDAAWPLPREARRVGRGKEARGRVALRRQAMALGSFDLGVSGLQAVLLAAAAFVLWRKLR